jgi:Uncharacterized protein conserved in bacteria (DUF2059)
MTKTMLLVAGVLIAAVPAVAQTKNSAVATDLAASTVLADPVVDPVALAEARLVVGHLMPAGVYKKVMGPMMAPVIDNIGATMKAMPMKDIARMGGLSEKDAAALGKIDIEQVMAIYDPHWQERMRLSSRAMFDSMGDFFTTLEPSLREAMAHAYVRHFTLGELKDLDGFFSTPSGDKFASQYMTIATDPAMIDAMKAMMPKMMQQMPQFIAAAQKATAALPPPRKIEDMTPAEKARIAKAIGVAPDKLQNPKAT